MPDIRVSTRCHNRTSMAVGVVKNGESVSDTETVVSTWVVLIQNEWRQLSLNSTRRKWRRIHYPHCNESLGKSCYYCHREAYYDAEKDQWRTEPERIPDLRMLFSYEVACDSSREHYFVYTQEYFTMYILLILLCITCQCTQALNCLGYVIMTKSLLWGLFTIRCA